MLRTSRCHRATNDFAEDSRTYNITAKPTGARELRQRVIFPEIPTTFNCSIDEGEFLEEVYQTKAMGHRTMHQYE
jgi:hypothetical protein